MPMPVTPVEIVPFDPPAIVQIVTGNPGGRVLDYLVAAANITRAGSRLQVRAPCGSACTAFLHVPAERICVGRYAAFLFHAAETPTATKLLWDGYPPAVQDWLTRRGGLTARVHVLNGPALQSLYAPCDPADRFPSTSDPSLRANRNGVPATTGTTGRPPGR